MRWFFEESKAANPTPVWVPAGKHQVRVRVQSAGERYDHSETVAVTFAPRVENTLRITTDKKHNLLQVALQ